MKSPSLSIPPIHQCEGRCVWLTPQLLIQRSIEVLGHISLDLCSNSHERPNVPALKHYTAEDDVGYSSLGKEQYSSTHLGVKGKEYP
jgi:hypothetical protein